MTDAAAAVVERYAYDPYGKPIILAPDGQTVRASSAISNPYLFTGRRWDAAPGLYYYRARMYDPGLGRFLSRDPLEYVDSLGLYEFVRSNPALNLDPNGEGVLSCLYEEVVNNPELAEACSAVIAACRAAPSPYNPACYAAAACVGGIAGYCVADNTTICNTENWENCPYAGKTVDYGGPHRKPSCTCHFSCPTQGRQDAPGQIVDGYTPIRPGVTRPDCWCPPHMTHTWTVTDDVIDW